MSECKPYIMQILRCSLHDGDGIRTVVYLKGCPLRCVWCHNPEGQSPRREIFYYPHKCIKCGRCAELCPQRHVIKDGAMAFLRQGCKSCLKCTDACPSGALSVCGEVMTPEQLMAEIKKDKHYFDSSGGGVTFSGGEALMYPNYLKQVLSLCRAEGISAAIESAMHVPQENAELLLPLTDFWLADIKHMDSVRHRQLTGLGNELILSNIKNIAPRARLLVRTPVVPGCNDDRDNLLRTARFALDSGASGLQLLKYNQLGENKYRFLRDADGFSASSQSDGQMDQICAELNTELKSNFVFWKV